jgi:hypothetical protein
MDKSLKPTTVATVIPRSIQYTFTSTPTSTSGPSSEANETLQYTIKLPEGATEQDYRIVAHELVMKGAVIHTLFACGFFGTLGVALSRSLLEELKNGKLDCCNLITALYPTIVRPREEAEEGKEDVENEAGMEGLFD